MYYIKKLVEVCPVNRVNRTMDNMNIKAWKRQNP